MRVLLLLMLLVPMAAQAQTLTVFAAASLTDAMKDIAALWVRAGHPEPRLSFGSSSTLARQIEQGAPADVFASADEQWMDYLANADLIVPDTRRDLLGNDLVLITPAAHPIHVVIEPGFDLTQLLGVDGRVATGDPAHVPAGMYAEQALRKLGLWDGVSSRIAAAADVRSALLLVERGEAPVGIVYSTDAAVTKSVMIAGTFPPASHDPITYPFAVTRSADEPQAQGTQAQGTQAQGTQAQGTQAQGSDGRGPQARAFLSFLSTPQARHIWVSRGFKVE